MKTNIKNILAKLKEHHRNAQTTAMQNLDFSDIKAGQLHRTLDIERNYDLFYFIVSKPDADHSEVLPGTFDSIHAVNTDIILPKNVLGDFIALSLDLATVIPDSAIGNCFAIPDEATQKRIVASLQQYRSGISGKIPSYPLGLPPISKYDPCIELHQQLKQVVEEAKTAGDTIIKVVVDFAQRIKEHFKLNPEPVWNMPELTIAAGDQKQCMADLEVEGIEETISVSYDNETKCLIINVFDADGEDSSALDGWKIFDAEARELGTICDSAAEIKDLQTCDGKICLVDPQGNVYLLTGKS